MEGGGLCEMTEDLGLTRACLAFSFKRFVCAGTRNTTRTKAMFLTRENPHAVFFGVCIACKSCFQWMSVFRVGKPVESA